MSRRSDDLPGRSGNPVAGQRAAGGTFQKCFELVGRVMHKSSLILRAMEWLSGKPSAINVACSVWEGGNGEGLESTSPVPYFIWEEGNEKGP
jgi:hypothetical protein